MARPAGQSPHWTGGRSRCEFCPQGNFHPSSWRTRAPNITHTVQNCSLRWLCGPRCRGIRLALHLQELQYPPIWGSRRKGVKRHGQESHPQESQDACCHSDATSQVTYDRCDRFFSAVRGAASAGSIRDGTRSRHQEATHGKESSEEGQEASRNQDTARPETAPRLLGSLPKAPRVPGRAASPGSPSRWDKQQTAGGHI